MTGQKLRLRFRKQGDLRLISHRDLARAFERLFRRANLPLAMSEGFHPHAKINFPSALSLGIAGDGEWVEAQLSEPMTADEAESRLTPQLPPGIELTGIWVFDLSHPKPQVETMTYEIPVPTDRHDAIQAAIVALLASSEHLIERENRRELIDLRSSLVDAQLDSDRLRFSLSASRTAQARPRDVLTALGLGDLEQQGFWLTRTEVQLNPF